MARHHGGAQRIEPDVTMASPQVVAVFGQTALVTTLPERAAVLSRAGSGSIAPGVDAAALEIIGGTHGAASLCRKRVRARLLRGDACTTWSRSRASALPRSIQYRFFLFFACLGAAESTGDVV